MTFLETIGFIVMVIFLFGGYIKKALDDRKRRANPEEFDRKEMEKAERLKDFLKSVNLDMQEQPKPKKVQKSASQQKKYVPPVLQPQEVQKPISSIEDRRLESKIENRKFSSSIDKHYGIRQKDAYSVVKAQMSNRALQSISELKSKKDMIILQELISPPRAFRKL